jgi:hypothetical protein
LPKIPASRSLRRAAQAVYDAELSTDAWPEALRTVTGALNVDGAACILFDKRTGLVDWACFSGLSAELETRYIDHYARLDPFSPLLNATPGWMTLLECLPPAALAKSEWYNDFVLSCGVRDMVGTRLTDSSSHFCIFGLHHRIGRSGAEIPTDVLKSLTAPLAAAALSRIRSLAASATPPAKKTIEG